MQVKVILGIFALIASFSSSAQFVDGNKLSLLSSIAERVNQGTASEDDYSNYFEFMGYIKGSYDANRSSMCLPVGTKVSQFMAVVSKYVRENPGKWHRSGDQLILLAVNEAFPCKKTN